MREADKAHRSKRAPLAVQPHPLSPASQHRSIGSIHVPVVVVRCAETSHLLRQTVFAPLSSFVLLEHHHGQTRMSQNRCRSRSLSVRFGGGVTFQYDGRVTVRCRSLSRR